MKNEKLLTVVELSETELYTINAGWSWQGAIGGCGTTTLAAVNAVGAGIHFAPPHMKVGYLAGACAWGGFWGGMRS
ncbi:hypothetical protein IR073_06785 [Gemella sp. 19428wG2_WT2a]|nr:hypothetical protein [Gemella sp. 19428wG2_WT2a]TFU57540.1 hypothetical protein E4T67_06705 [Gemella sp. WT2a]